MVAVSVTVEAASSIVATDAEEAEEAEEDGRRSEPAPPCVKAKGVESEGLKRGVKEKSTSRDGQIQGSNRVDRDVGA